jgi:Fe-S-cluster containining protein
MADDKAWQADRFAAALTVELAGLLAGVKDVATLAGALAACDAAAEAVTSGRCYDCSPGCPHCCVLNVAILLPEGLVIAGWLRDHLQPAEFAALHDRLVRHSCWVRWMDDDERILKRAGCPFLGADGKCMIYPVRPLVCRAAHSLDRACCQESFRPAVTGERLPVPLDLLRQSVFDTAFVSLAASLRHHGLDDRSIELGCGVLAFLDQPDNRGRYLSGERLPRELWQG